ncbi:MAG: hypothetical protein AAF737_01735 [Pseudomonadota bacterium]
MDWRVRLRGPLHEGESNPGSTDVRPGGVAHNVWHALKRLERDAELVSLEAPETRIYMAVENQDGSLAHGIACLDAYDDLDDVFLYRHIDQMSRADVLVADGNCAHKLFDVLPTHPCMALIAVSPAKMDRMRPALAKANWLFCNRAELAQLRSDGWRPPAPLHIVETRGKDGLVLHAGDQRNSFAPPDLRQITVDETGLGDALAACILAQFHHASTLPAEGIISMGLESFAEFLTRQNSS